MCAHRKGGALEAAEKLVWRVIPRSRRRRGISHCVENTQSEIPRSARNDSLEGFFRSLLVIPVPPGREESAPQSFGNVLSTDWIPAFAGMTGTFAGMTGAFTGMTCGPNGATHGEDRKDHGAA